MRFIVVAAIFIMSGCFPLPRIAGFAIYRNKHNNRLVSLQVRRALSSASTITTPTTNFDVIVVGGGHAGCEAAAAAARTGARTCLVTQRCDTIGELSCNPSIGGIGKGHLVREIDALDGLMGKVADDAGIHYRVLNRRKGLAVRGPRAQMDRDLYKASMQATLDQYANLQVFEASVQDLLLDESQSQKIESLAPLVTDAKLGIMGAQQQKRDLVAEATSHDRYARIRGVQVTKEDGSTHELFARAVVITTGTFLRGVLMMGQERYAGGRHLRDSEQVEPPSVGLAKTLARFDFPLGRLKTGTPPRIDGRTIDWDILKAQPSEVPAQPFSHLLQFYEQQPPNIAAGMMITCYQTATNEQTHSIVMQYEHLLPQYDGMEGKGNGPRYCPSIYKKVQRFPEREGHNCFLEPEGLNTDIVYPNGMSGPYPPDIQQKIMRSMLGLGAVEIVRPGYDVEYDFVNPTCLTHTLETKKIGGLYLAGQICGTTGYEEAAAQGIVAGANAGRAAVAAASGEKGALPFVVGRDEGYIGVLIDDLVTRGTLEPYRMFTSRAEYRISLRADNADMRLTRKGVDFSLVVDEERISALYAREDLLDNCLLRLKSFEMKVVDWAEKGGAHLMGGAQMVKRIGSKKTAADVLGMPLVTLKDVEDIMVAVDGLNMTRSPKAVADTVEATIKYNSYAIRQQRDMNSWRRAQGVRIPPDVAYTSSNFPCLSNEELEKLDAVRPNTFADASQISGITPQSLIYLHHYVNDRIRKRDGDQRTSKKQTVQAQ